MELTSEQLLTLKNYINSVPEWAALPNTPDDAFFIAAALNKPGNPTVTVWRTYVTAEEIMANGFVWTAVDSMTNGKARIWDWMTRFGGFNPSKTNIRQGLQDAFGAGTAMANGILPHLKRFATICESLYSTGTGTDANPGTLTVEGNVTYQQVQTARSM